MQRGLKLDEEVPVKLTDEQLLARGETMAEKIGYRAGLVASASADAKKWRAQVLEVDGEIARLARVILGAYELRKQSDLKFGDQATIDQAAATAALAEIARHAEGNGVEAPEPAP
jgi:hypothetical protein